MTDVDLMMTSLAEADTAYMETVKDDLETVQAALQTYQDAEALNLGDYCKGRYSQEAGEAWSTLAAAREALATKAAAAETERQTAIKAAITAANS